MYYKRNFCHHFKITIVIFMFKFCEYSATIDDMGVFYMKERQTGPDIVRFFAALFVIAVHFYLNCGYYAEPLITPKLYLMTAARWLFLICVPLFMILTGYCKSEKTMTASHYKSLIPITVSYFIISIAKMFMCNYIYGEVYTFKYGLSCLFNYNMSWYFGMYLSIMLLIPFLNLMWKAIPTKKAKLVLIGSLAFVSTLYPVFIYVVPSYWQMLYPFVYYFVGVYIKEYQPHLSKKKWLLALLITVIVFAEATVSYIFADGGNFNWLVLGPIDSGYSTITVVISAVAFFLIFYDVQLKSRIAGRILARISSVSWEIYLFNSVFDAYIFYYLRRFIYTTEGFFWWFFVTVPMSFLLSLIASLFYRDCYNLIVRGITYLRNRSPK